MNSARVAFVFAAVIAPLAAGAQKPGKTHKLEASPTTVAYGYYSPTATPVLRIASGVEGIAAL